MREEINNILELIGEFNNDEIRIVFNQYNNREIFNEYSQLWVKAFSIYHFYNPQNYRSIYMGCFPCYSKVYNFLKTI